MEKKAATPPRPTFTPQINAFSAALAFEKPAHERLSTPRQRPATESASAGGGGALAADERPRGCNGRSAHASAEWYERTMSRRREEEARVRRLAAERVPRR